MCIQLTYFSECADNFVSSYFIFHFFPLWRCKLQAELVKTVKAIAILYYTISPLFHCETYCLLSCLLSWKECAFCDRAPLWYWWKLLLVIVCLCLVVFVHNCVQNNMRRNDTFWVIKIPSGCCLFQLGVLTQDLFDIHSCEPKIVIHLVVSSCFCF